MVKNENKRFMQLLNQDEKSIDLYIYGDIVDYKWYEEDVTANDIKTQIQELKVDEINVHINSYGGDVFTGIAIYNMLKNHPAKVNVYVDACACSIASVIAMAGDKVYMPKNTLMMIHNAWTVAMGNSKDLRKTAEDLDVIMNASIESYMAKVNITKEELIKLLDAETWLTAEECVKKGFADEIIPLNENEGINQSAMLYSLVQKLQKLERQEPIQEEENNVDEITAESEISKENSENEESTEDIPNEEKTTEIESPIKAFLNYINERKEF